MKNNLEIFNYIANQYYLYSCEYKLQFNNYNYYLIIIKLFFYMRCLIIHLYAVNL